MLTPSVNSFLNDTQMLGNLFRSNPRFGVHGIFKVLTF